MKKSLIFILFVNLSFSQIPQDYYNTAVGSGYALKSQLANIISSGHEDQGYDLLYLPTVNRVTQSTLGPNGVLESILLALQKLCVQSGPHFNRGVRTKVCFRTAPARGQKRAASGLRRN